MKSYHGEEFSIHSCHLFLSGFSCSRCAGLHLSRTHKWTLNMYSVICSKKTSSSTNIHDCRQTPALWPELGRRGCPHCRESEVLCASSTAAQPARAQAHTGFLWWEISSGALSAQAVIVLSVDCDTRQPFWFLTPPYLSILFKSKNQHV